MRVVRRPTARWLALLVTLLAIAACGNGDSSTARSAATASGVVASSATTASAPASATTSADAPSTPASAAVTVAGYAALPQSKTPEGYYVLGDPNAPATITFYSDFI